MKCETKIESRDIDINWYNCDNEAKYKVKHIDVVTGKEEIINLCGIHKNSHLAWSRRVKKILDFDSKSTITLIK